MRKWENITNSHMIPLGISHQRKSKFAEPNHKDMDDLFFLLNIEFKLVVINSKYTENIAKQIKDT